MRCLHANPKRGRCVRDTLIPIFPRGGLCRPPPALRTGMQLDFPHFSLRGASRREIIAKWRGCWCISQPKLGKVRTNLGHGRTKKPPCKVFAGGFYVV